MKPNLVCRALSALLFASLAGCATLPKDFPKTESQTPTDTSGTALGRLAGKAISRHGNSGESGLLLLPSGLDSFVARAVLAQRAQRSIDAQYYLLNDDLSGNLFIHRLLKAADRGVSVRLLVDDMGLAGRDPGGAALDNHPNVEVRIFNPFARNVPRMLQMVTRFGSVTRRMHNKSFTVDGQISILGGRNVGDEYFAADSELDFGDLDALVIGPAVREVSDSFDQYWNSALAYPVVALRGRSPNSDEIERERKELDAALATPENGRYRDALADSDLARRLRADSIQLQWGPARVIADEPEKIAAPRKATEFHLTPLLRPYFESAKSEIILVSPYFVPTKVGAEYLAGLARRGIRVRVMTNSLAATDVPAVHAGYKRYRKRLLRAGVELYEVRDQAERLDGRDVKWMGGSSKTSLHAKSIVFDRRNVFIGSFNFDPRSAKENTEIGIVVDSREIGQQLGTNFDQKIGDIAYRLELSGSRGGAGGKLLWHQGIHGDTQTFDKEPHTTFLKRLGTGLIGLLPIESQL